MRGSKRNRLATLLARFTLVNLILFLSLLMALGAAGAAETGATPALRVLIDQRSSVDIKVLSGTYQWYDEDLKMLVEPVASTDAWHAAAAGSSIKLEKNGRPLAKAFGGPLLLQALGDGENRIEINGKKYRGSLRLYHLRSQGASNLALINVIDVETYLYGVVGQEIGLNAPEEAMKTQAVVSRTYALQKRERRAQAGDFYDLRDDQGSQVYKGADGESPKVRKAVDDTRGQVITFDGALIEAVFHSNSGGYTEDARWVWNSDVPYLRGVPAPEDKYAEEWGGTAALAYHWRKNLSPADVARKTLSLTGKDPGEVQRLRVAETTASGRVIRLDVVGSRGTVTVERDRVRQLLDAPSTKFTVTDGGASYMVMGYGAEGLRKSALPAGGIYGITAEGQAEMNSDFYVITPDGAGPAPKTPSTASGGSIVLDGYGFGHGVGLSQWGAMGLARDGKGYNDIIEHYYNADRRDGRLRIMNNWGK
ncbi:SpoIID/LytB domain-containing protein [Heliobacterium gestii]|uniref:SpoIID/LytB domain-containing protein n=1 Tax=Heliomicrobium gestii TaxID=2699 RepID=A0A845LG55_HELGE|nr:SpoIID/LytB domain-containing protein [Heliomicrobium gestii]MBM7868065.1 stage II sporulation protein D [Heliomicrobium gestii]MZP44404.1 SpoIID/LytB domain-containing protein [Heliomicrobium gestii]